MKKIRQAWTEANWVKRTLAVCALLTAVGTAVGTLSAYAENPIEFYLSKKLDSLHVFSRLDSLESAVDTLKKDTVTKADLDTVKKELTGELKQIHQQQDEMIGTLKVIQQLVVQSANHR